MLVQRLDFGPGVREALRFTFERWNGNGYPAHASGEAIPLAMRVVHLSHDMEAIGRLFSPAKALEAARERRDRTYDPALADLFVAHGPSWFDRLEKTEPWDAVLDLEPEPHRMLNGADARRRPHGGGGLRRPEVAVHGRTQPSMRRSSAPTPPGCSGSPRMRITTLRRAALVHDFGTTAVPNSIWDKPGALTRAEFDRVELHPMLTEQMLRRSPALAALNPVASAHHEKSDGSGYHKRVRGDAADPGASVLAAAEIYVGMTTERADRPAFSAEDAAAELRRLASRRRARASRDPRRARGRRSRRAGSAAGPAGRSIRAGSPVVKSTCCASRRGDSRRRQIADRLYISPKTADHHIQHIYNKIGVSTRAAAALWAMQHAVVR